MKAADGSLDLMKWETGIPGKAGVSAISQVLFTSSTRLETACRSFFCLDVIPGREETGSAAREKQSVKGRRVELELTVSPPPPFPFFTLSLSHFGLNRHSG